MTKKLNVFLNEFLPLQLYLVIRAKETVSKGVHGRTVYMRPKLWDSPRLLLAGFDRCMSMEIQTRTSAVSRSVLLEGSFGLVDSHRSMRKQGCRYLHVLGVQSVLLA
jgi:hypothetical protein